MPNVVLDREQFQKIIKRPIKIFQKRKSQTYFLLLSEEGERKLYGRLWLVYVYGEESLGLERNWKTFTSTRLASTLAIHKFFFYYDFTHISTRMTKKQWLFGLIYIPCC